MNDRETLTMLYGALKAMKGVNPELIRLLEEHLFPNKASAERLTNALYGHKP